MAKVKGFLPDGKLTKICTHPLAGDRYEGLGTSNYLSKQILSLFITECFMSLKGAVSGGDDG